MAGLVAWPVASRLTGAPQVQPSTTNWTVPAGVTAVPLVLATVAVNVTDWPGTAGSAEEVTCVAVAARLTVCVRASRLRVKLLSPL